MRATSRGGTRWMGAGVAGASVRTTNHATFRPPWISWKIIPDLPPKVNLLLIKYIINSKLTLDGPN